jgi:hypothetical protein
MIRSRKRWIGLANRMLMNLSLVIRFRFNVFAAISFRIDEINPSTKLCVIFIFFILLNNCVIGRASRTVYSWILFFDWCIFFGDNIEADIYIFEASSFVETINSVSTQNSFLRDCLSDQRQGWALSFKMSIKFK